MPPTPPPRTPRRGAPTPDPKPILGTTDVHLLTGIREKALAGPEELIPHARFRVGRCWKWRRSIVERWLLGEDR